jgi:hypothetical protein
MSLLTKKVIIWGLEFDVDYYYHDADEPNVLESVEIGGVYVEGSEQDLYEVISDEVLGKIIEKIHDSHE